MRSVGLGYILWIPPLGVIGVHRFYCGRIGTGLLWLFTAGLCGIGWLVDVFLIPGLVRQANAGVRAQLLSHLGPGCDHPVSVSHLEGDYLKGLHLRRL